MPSTPRTLTRLAAALALSLTVLGPAAAQPASNATAVTADTGDASPRLDAAQARRDAAQARVDAASAELARIRGELFTAADPAETARLRSEEHDAQTRKDTLVAALEERDRQLTRIAADVAREAQAQADADRAAGVPTEDAAADSPTGIVLAPSVATPTATTPADATLTTDGAVTADAAATGGASTPAPDAATIDAYLAGKLSPLTGMGSTFVAESAKVGLDPRFLVAVAGAETSFGTYGPSQAIHNPFGLGPGMSFADWGAAIRAAAQNLGGRLYRGAGLVTIGAINGRWAPSGAANDPTNLNSNWSRNVGHYYSEQGGDPAASVFVGVTATAAATTATTPGTTTATSTAGPAAAAEALTLLGAPYGRDGHAGGVDAGGLVQSVYGRQGVTVPATPAALFRAGTAVEPAGLRAGDAVFFSDPDGRVVHVGLYLGAGQFVHAPGPGDVVGLASLYDSVWAASYAGARRY